METQYTSHCKEVVMIGLKYTLLYGNRPRLNELEQLRKSFKIYIIVWKLCKTRPNKNNTRTF